ncbi:MAG: cytochrome c biogenesis protein CcsA [Nitriliruptoraceae bacterium]
MRLRSIGLLGFGMAFAASFLVVTQASREFYGVDHPVNLLFYAHVSVAWVGFAGLVIAAIASAAFLHRQVLSRSWLAQAAVRVSFVFLTLTLATGMVWGRFIWNSWWEWSDIRLVTALLVWLIYAGYLLYHQHAQDIGDLRRGAVFCVMASVSAPITVASTRLWQSPFHGTTMGGDSVTIHYPAFALALVGTSAIYVYLVALRRRLHAAQPAAETNLEVVR